MIELLLILLTGLFEDEFARVTNETGINFLIVEHEDLSVTLYGWNNDTVNVGLDGFPDKMTPLAGYANELALYGSNGVTEILSKIPLWNLTTS